MTTYYVDGSVGNDANAGTAEGAGNAWATIDKAMNTVAAGDIVYIKASTSYNETATMDVSGNADNPITFEGYTTTPGDEGKVTMDGTSLTNCLVGGTNIGYYIFKNIIFDGAGSVGCALSSNDYCWFHNCEITNHTSIGLQFDNYLTLTNCIVSGNGNDGVVADLVSFVGGCIFHTQAIDDFDVALGIGLVYRSVFYGRPASSQAIDNAGTSIKDYYIGCTFDGEGTANSRAIDTAGASTKVVDCIIYDFSGAGSYGVILGTPVESEAARIYNLMNSNSTDYAETGVMVGYNDVTSAPAFTDEAGDDYTLGSSSPAIDAGINPGGVT